MMTARCVLPAVCVVLCATTAAGQETPRIPRPYQGLFGGAPPRDPNRTRQELTVRSGLMGGYDDQFAAGQNGISAASQAAEGIWSSVVDVALQYYLGRSARSLSIDVDANRTDYGDVENGTLTAAALRVQGAMELGRRSRVAFTQDVAHDPSLVLGAFGPLEGVVEPGVLPDSGQTSGYVQQRSWASSTSIRFERTVTTRQSGTVGYSHAQRTYLDETGYDRAAHTVTAQYNWAFRRTSTLRTSYAGTDSTMRDQQGVATPMGDHNIQISGTHIWRRSPTRQIQVSFGGGATYVDTVRSLDRAPLSYWTPSGQGTLRIDVGRSWSVAGDYRRGVSVLQGVTLESFSTDAASVRADGTLGARVQLALSTTFSNGRAGGDQPGRYESYNATSELRYAFARWAALTAAYDYYYYRMTDIASRPVTVPSEFDRNAVRLGVSFWVPLYGGYAAGSERRQASAERRR